MKILFSVHLYPPKHNCGGEYYIHNMAKYLISKGHECRVLLNQAFHYDITHNYNFEGVEVVVPDRQPEANFRWADRVLTHLEYTNDAIQKARIFKKPVFFIVHNNSIYDCVSIESERQRKMYIIYNSEHLKEACNYDHASFVLPPAIDKAKYDLGKDPVGNKFITLINMNKNKGGETFKGIAKAMPDRQFLGITGSYDEQVKINLPNVKILPNSPNILPVYDQTRILLMPSKYESWGMTATEAMCNGIPVLCTKTPGLFENTGGKAVYLDRDDTQAWVKAIKKLDDPKAYKVMSKKMRDRATELQPDKKLDELEKFIIDAT